MSIFDTISKPEDRSTLVTILGDAGLGKSSLASTFPNPIFIRAEDGLQAIPLDIRPDAFPVLKQAADLWAQLSCLITDPHDYKTLVIDSVTALERMFIDYIVESDPKKRPQGQVDQSGNGRIRRRLNSSSSDARQG